MSKAAATTAPKASARSAPASSTVSSVGAWGGGVRASRRKVIHGRDEVKPRRSSIGPRPSASRSMATE